MIITDYSRLPKDWKNRFKHRDCDPENYSVGVFPELNPEEYLPVTLVLNTNTNCLMEYFYDDVDYLSEININYKNLYKNYCILKHKDGFILRNKKFNTERALFYNEEKTYFRTQYPFIKLSMNEYQKNISIHILIANTFVPNPYPDKFTIINHKNKNKKDYSIENLEFCDYYWNCQSENKNFISKEGKISTLNDYLSRHPLIGDIWYKHPTINNLFANPSGVLKSTRGMTVGHLVKDKLTYEFRSHKTHRLIVECIIGRELEKDEIIDHIIPVSMEDINNEFSNLRICSQKENMNNRNTIEKLSTKCYSCDLFGENIQEYSKISDVTGKSTSNAFRCLTVNNKIIYTTEEQMKEKLSYIYYKFTKEGLCIGAGTSFADITPELSKKVR